MGYRLSPLNALRAFDPEGLAADTIKSAANDFYNQSIVKPANDIAGYAHDLVNDPAYFLHASGPTVAGPGMSIPTTVVGTPAAAGGLTAAEQLAANRAAGAAFERTVGANLEQSGLNVGQQITIETQSGVRTRLDFFTQDPLTGKVGCIECKASPTAPLSPNQILAFPEIGQTWGTIVGAGKPGFPGGMQLSPTAVQIIRGP